MDPLTPEEIALLRALVKPAIVLLILRRFDRPVTTREIAGILGKDRSTIAGYLRRLVDLHLVVRVSYHGGYLLADDARASKRDPTRRAGKAKLNDFPDLPVINIIHPNLDPDSLATITTQAQIRLNARRDRRDRQRRQGRPGKPAGWQPSAQDTPQQAALRQTLREAGILEPRRSALLALPHLTPQIVKGWERYLKLVKGDRYSTGLLIHVLESGDPPPSESALPPTNPNGHPKSCQCPDCQRLKFLICPYCSRYPCECP